MEVATARMTQAQYARHRGVSRPAVLKAIRSGRIRLGQDGKIDPVEADASWRRNTDPSKPSNSVSGNPRGAAARLHRPLAKGRHTTPEDSSAGPNYNLSRAVREAYLAKLVRLEYERKSGNLRDAAEVRKAFFEANRRARDLLLALPDRAAATVAGLTEAAECHRILTAEVERVCDELSRVERA